MNEMISVMLLPRNGFTPVSISNRMTPAANRSVRLSTGAPANCSGAMYAGVPNKSPTIVNSEASIRAMPKSATLTSPLLNTMMFDGLTSR